MCYPELAQQVLTLQQAMAGLDKQMSAVGFSVDNLLEALSLSMDAFKAEFSKYVTVSQLHQTQLAYLKYCCSANVQRFIALFLILRYECPAVYCSTLETCCTSLLPDEFAAGLCLFVKAKERKPSCQMKPVLLISVPICPKMISPIHPSR